MAWLTQVEMAELFHTTKLNIAKHLKAIFTEKVDRSHAPAWERSLHRSSGVYWQRPVSGEDAVVDTPAPRSETKP
ncbi:MAG: hypothetical protein Q8K59_13420 [Nitrosomonas sp.]|nr:hypothetical protein [Nitrosomonas sp.]MDP1952056.1 hypothetical protein [Nitrosomonas sp.]